MLWHALSEPQRHLPCGEAGVAVIGRPVLATVSDEPNLGRRRT
jgi:hypothetical protein